MAPKWSVSSKSGIDWSHSSANVDIDANVNAHEMNNSPSNFILRLLRTVSFFAGIWVIFQASHINKYKNVIPVNRCSLLQKVAQWFSACRIREKISKYQWVEFFQEKKIWLLKMRKAGFVRSWAGRLLAQIWRVKDRAPIYFTGVSCLRQIRLNTKKGRIGAG